MHGNLNTKLHRLFMYSRLTATDANGVQAGALHTIFVCPGFTQRVLRPLVYAQCWNESNVNKCILHFSFFCTARHYIESGLTSEVEVALHRCSRATGGPQKKSSSCKHPVKPSELHLHLWAASGSTSPFASSFYTSGVLQAQRGGVVIAVMWSTGLAVEGVGGAIHWKWDGGLCLSRHEPLKW